MTHACSRSIPARPARVGGEGRHRDFRHGGFEHGVTAPPDDDLEKWYRACAADNQLDDLKASARAIESMYVEWRRGWRVGLRHNQEARNALHERTSVFRIYESGIIPGILQTPEHAATVIAKVIEFNQVPNDLDEAVAARLQRQRYLSSADRRFLIVLEEQAIRTRFGSAEVWIFDQNTARIETPSAELTITQRGEIAVYEKRFAWLQDSALFGGEAKAIVRQVLAEFASAPTWR